MRLKVDEAVRAAIKATPPGRQTYLDWPPRADPPVAGDRWRLSGKERVEVEVVNGKQRLDGRWAALVRPVN